MYDQHCHILWGVDDGAQTRQESMLMLDAAQKAGIDHIMCTPHLRWKDFDREKVERHFADFKQEAEGRGIKAELGFEVYYKSLLKRGLHHAPEWTLGDSNLILIEFNSGGEVSFGWEQTVDKLQSEYGLDVIIAHPERYTTVLEDFETVYRMKDAGCMIQVSANDLARGFFDKRTKVAKRIIKEGLCDALVSDAHSPEHYATYVKFASKLGKL